MNDWLAIYLSVGAVLWLWLIPRDALAGMLTVHPKKYRRIGLVIGSVLFVATWPALAVMLRRRKR